MPGSLTYSWLDYGREPSSTTVHTPDVDDTNIDSISTGAVTLGTAFDNISLCTLTRRKLTAWNAFLSAATPASENAQREIKWLISYRDTVTGLPGSVTVPGAMTSLLTGNTDLIDLTAGGWPGFVTTFEANAVSNIGNPVEVVEIKLTGWNL